MVNVVFLALVIHTIILLHSEIGYLFKKNLKNAHGKPTAMSIFSFVLMKINL